MTGPPGWPMPVHSLVVWYGGRTHPPSQALVASALPESSGGGAPSSATPESESPPEDPPLDELPLEEPLPEELPLDDPLLEEPLLEDAPPEDPPLDEPPPESRPPEAPAPGELEAHAWTTSAAVASAKPNVRTDRTCMPGHLAIAMP